jgi:hypothetical protein
MCPPLTACLRSVFSSTLVSKISHPLTMIVAVAAFFPPPQQSPILGQRASSQTVCRPRPRRSFLILVYDGPVGILVLRWEGRRGLGSRYEHNTSIIKKKSYWEVFPSVILEASGSSGSTLSATKSLNEGPAASFVENVGVVFGTAVARRLSPEIEEVDGTRAVLNAKRQTCMMAR